MSEITPKLYYLKNTIHKIELIFIIILILF